MTLSPTLWQAITVLSVLLWIVRRIPNRFV